MNRDRTHFLFLNIGHFLDHLFTLIFATVAALALSREWGLSYGELLKYATPGFFAFGVFSYPAGWLADKWSREGMRGAEPPIGADRQTRALQIVIVEDRVCARLRCAEALVQIDGRAVSLCV